MHWPHIVQETLESPLSSKVAMWTSQDLCMGLITDTLCSSSQVRTQRVHMMHLLLSRMTLGLASTTLTGLGEVRNLFMSMPMSSAIVWSSQLPLRSHSGQLLS